MEALHKYVSDFFHQQGLQGFCSRNFDETALLALGMNIQRQILMSGVIVEELVSECMGENGHKIFIEQNGNEELVQGGEEIGEVGDGTDSLGSEENDSELSYMDDEESVQEHAEDVFSDSI